MSSTQFKALCLMALVAACLVTGTSGASAAERSRKLLQRWYNPSSMQANQVRAQAATSQSIEEAVNRGATRQSTSRAAATGVATSWAAGQRDDVYNAVDKIYSPTNRGWGD